MPTRHIFITGAGRGIGLGLTQEMIREGHRVTAGARTRTPEIENLAKEFPHQLKVMDLDVSSRRSIQAAVHALQGEAVDVLVNNAGVSGDMGGGLATLTQEDMEETYRSNVVSVAMMTQEFLPLLKKATPYGVVANMSSLMGSIGDNKSGGSYSYRLSKAALNMLTKNLAIELQPAHIALITLHPGWVQTRMGGGQAPLQVKESTAGLTRVILQATMKDSGSFLDYRGQKLPW